MHLRLAKKQRFGFGPFKGIVTLGVLLGCCCGVASLHASSSSELEVRLRADCESAWKAQLAQLDDVDVRWREDSLVFYSPEFAKKKGKDRKTSQRYLHVWLSRERQAAVAEYSRTPEYEPVTLAMGYNAQYQFDVARSDPSDRFRLDHFAKEKTWPTDFSAGETGNFLSSLGVLLVGLGSLDYTLPQMLDSPEFTLTSYVAEPGGPGRRMVATFRQQYVLPSGKPQGDPVEWRVVLDPNQDWAPVEWTVTHKTLVEKIRVEYQPGPAGVVFPREILKEMIVPGTPQNSTARWTIEPPTRFTGSTAAAYLSHYGLPEPGGSGIPWWGWVLVVGVVIIAMRMGWLYLRRKA